MSLLGTKREQSRLDFKRALVVSATGAFALCAVILLAVIYSVKRKVLLAVI